MRMPVIRNPDRTKNKSTPHHPNVKRRSKALPGVGRINVTPCASSTSRIAIPRIPSRAGTRSSESLGAGDADPRESATSDCITSTETARLSCMAISHRRAGSLRQRRLLFAQRLSRRIFEIDALALEDVRPPLNQRVNRAYILAEQAHEDELDRNKEEDADDQRRHAHREAVPVKQLIDGVAERNQNAEE